LLPTLIASIKMRRSPRHKAGGEVLRGGRKLGSRAPGCKKTYQMLQQRSARNGAGGVASKEVKEANRRRRRAVQGACYFEFLFRRRFAAIPPPETPTPSDIHYAIAIRHAPPLPDAPDRETREK